MTRNKLVIPMRNKKKKKMKKKGKKIKNKKIEK